MTAQTTIANVAKIKLSFPTLKEGFFDILIARMKAYKASDVEFKRAVDHVIDTCKFPTPQIADFISFIRPNGKEDIPQDAPKTPTHDEIAQKDKEYEEWRVENDRRLRELFKMGEYAEPEIKMPEGFEDFEPSR